MQIGNSVIRCAIPTFVVAMVVTAVQPAWAQPRRDPPPISGLTVRVAKQRLKAAGFTVLRDTDRPWYQFLWVETSIPDNWRVCLTDWEREFNQFNVLVAPACVAKIPLLVGKRLNAAVRILSSLGLVYRDSRLIGIDGSEGNWVVCDQEPRAGSRASLRRERNYFVTLTLAPRGHCSET